MKHASEVVSTFRVKNIKMLKNVRNFILEDMWNFCGGYEEFSEVKNLPDSREFTQEFLKA